jgi:hypothetical protein
MVMPHKAQTIALGISTCYVIALAIELFDETVCKSLMVGDDGKGEKKAVERHRCF